jgi:hypothetical protein
MSSRPARLGAVVLEVAALEPLGFEFGMSLIIAIKLSNISIGRRVSSFPTVALLSDHAALASLGRVVSAVGMIMDLGRVIGAFFARDPYP